MNNMTALMSCYVRYYHDQYKYKIFSDNIATKILSDEEKNNIKNNLIEGIQFFKSNDNETIDERYVIDNFLSPSVLGRSIYAEKSLIHSIKFGVRQYLIFASGYDTFAYRHLDVLDKLKVFEIDKQELLEDKKKRLERAGIDYSKVNFVPTDFNNHTIKIDNYDSTKLTFCSLLGISYYLDKDSFIILLKNISDILKSGSTIVFDYPIKDNKIINTLAAGANEEMKVNYTTNQLEQILDECDLLLYENLTNIDMDKQYFYNYNTLNPSHRIIAPSNVNYCLVVKR